MQNDACYTLLSHEIYLGTSDLSEHRAKKKISLVQEEQKKMGYLMSADKYTNNASLIAVLIVTITFVAVFSAMDLHVPAARYDTANSLPVSVIATKEVPLKVFLTTYTIAMLSSLAVCFSTTYIRDNYKVLARILLVFAYVATTVAFVSGLYLVAPKSLIWPVLVTLSLVCIIAILIRFKYMSGAWSRRVFPRFISRVYHHFVPRRY